MALSACTRRLSGSVRARACSVTTSAGQPLGLRSSNALSGLDALCRDTPALCASGKDTALDALGLGLFTAPAAAPTPSQKLLGFAALGRPPPARRSPNENDAANTLPREPSAGPLWRPPGLCASTSTSTNVLADPAQLLAHSQDSQVQTQAPGPASSRPAPAASSPIRLADELLPGVMEGHAQAHARCSARAASLAVRSPRAGAPGSTLEPNPSQGIYAGEPEPGKALAIPSASVSSSAMPSPSLSRSGSSSSSNMPPPPPPPGPLLRIPSGMKIPMPPAPTRPPSPSPSTPSSHSSFARAFSHSHSHSGRGSPGLPHAPPPSPLYSPTPTSPRAPAFVPESPIARSRRTPSPARTPPMRVHSSAAEHTLVVRLPEGLAPEMVTVCAKKGARLSVVADLWHRESDSHYEWEVAFAPSDVDMTSVRAVFAPDGQLIIHVRRRSLVDGLPSPKVCTPF